jgi:dimethylaniline monooxygenase (N-oxide forming)
MEMVDKGEFIDIHRASIASFNTNSVVLSNGTTLNCSAVVFASGWERTQTKIFPPSELLTLGLPVPISQQPPDYEKNWSALDTAADEKVCSIFPFLRNPPPELFKRQNPTTPFRLYRYIAPPTQAAAGDRSLAFLGCLSNIRNPSFAEVSALWATAYLLDLLPNPVNEVLADQAEMETRISEVNAWERRRYRDKASRYPVGGLEIQDFMDVLMQDLGLEPERKRGKGPRGFLGLRAWAREWFWPYMSADYKGIVEEFKAGLEKSEV